MMQIKLNLPSQLAARRQPSNAHAAKKKKKTVRADVRNTYVGKSGYSAAMLRMQMNNHAERRRKHAKKTAYGSPR